MNFCSNTCHNISLIYSRSVFEKETESVVVWTRYETEGSFGNFGKNTKCNPCFDTNPTVMILEVWKLDFYKLWDFSGILYVFLRYLTRNIIFIL